MKVYFYGALLCLFLSNQLQAQSALFEYNNLVNLAELSICDSNFSEANNYYQKAFIVNNKKPFSKDLLNAFYSAMDSRQYKLAESYIAKLLARGLGRTFINGKLLKYYSGERLEKLKTFLKVYPDDTLRNRALAQKIDLIVRRDQEVRKYYSDLNDGAYMVDSTYRIDSLNAIELSSLFKKHGVPNEIELGNSLLNNFSVTSNPDYGILVLHNNAGSIRPKQSHLFDSILYKAVLNLDYEAHSFANLISRDPLSASFQCEHTVLLFPFMIDGFFYEGKIYPRYFDDPSEKKMNEQRAKIGLESLDDFRKKITAHNIGQSELSVLHKYFFVVNMTVEDGADEIALKKWLLENDKTSLVRRSILYDKPTIVKREFFDYGNLGGKYVINQSRFNQIISEYKMMNKEYYQGQIFYSKFKSSKSSLPWNYHAEIICDSFAAPKTDSMRTDLSRFVPGIKMLTEYSYDFPGLGRFKDIELLFESDLLMSFAAKVDTSFYKTVMRILGSPAIVEAKLDTTTCTFDKSLAIILATKIYTWKMGEIKMEFVATESLSRNCARQSTAAFSMVDNRKYETYMKTVNNKNKSLNQGYRN